MDEASQTLIKLLAEKDFNPIKGGFSPERSIKTQGGKSASPGKSPNYSRSPDKQSTWYSSNKSRSPDMPISAQSFQASVSRSPNRRVSSPGRTRSPERSPERAYTSPHPSQIGQYMNMRPEEIHDYLFNKFGKTFIYGSPDNKVSTYKPAFCTEEQWEQYTNPKKQGPRSPTRSTVSFDKILELNARSKASPNSASDSKLSSSPAAVRQKSPEVRVQLRAQKSPEDSGQVRRQRSPEARVEFRRQRSPEAAEEDKEVQSSTDARVEVRMKKPSPKRATLRLSSSSQKSESRSTKPSDTFLIEMLKSQLDLERSIEELKIDLLMQEDFNLEDAFKLFTSDSYISELDLKAGLSQLKVSFTDSAVESLLSKSPNGDQLDLKSFVSIIMPKQQECLSFMTSKMTYASRSSLSQSFSTKTLRQFGRLMAMIIEQEDLKAQMKQSMNTSHSTLSEVFI